MTCAARVPELQPLPPEGAWLVCEPDFLNEYLLALILIVPALAQQPDQPAKPAINLPPRPLRRSGCRCGPAAADQKIESPVPAPVEDWLTGSVDLGYRWVSDAGNFQSYRSVVNLDKAKLTGLEFTILDPKKRLFDVWMRAPMDGRRPLQPGHVDARKLNVYDFSFDYRNIAYFNAMPSYSNRWRPRF